LILAASQILHSAEVTYNLRIRKPTLDSLINFRIGVSAKAFNGFALNDDYSHPQDHLVFTPHLEISGAMIIKRKLILAGSLSFGKYKAENDLTQEAYLGYNFDPAYGLLVQQSGNVRFLNFTVGYRIYDSSKFSIESSLGLGWATYKITNSQVTFMTPNGATIDKEKLTIRKSYDNTLPEFNCRFIYVLSKRLQLDFSAGVLMLNRSTEGIRLEISKYRNPLLCNRIGITFNR
jgi:hypothetical protein